MSKTDVLENRIDNVDKTLQEIKNIAQATHDQALKTNGRVNRLDEWKDSHSGDSLTFIKEVRDEIKGINKTLNIWAGGISVIVFLSGVFGYLYTSSIENRITDNVLKKIADQYTVVQLQNDK